MLCTFRGGPIDGQVIDFPRWGFDGSKADTLTMILPGGTPITNHPDILAAISVHLEQKAAPSFPGRILRYRNGHNGEWLYVPHANT